MNTNELVKWINELIEKDELWRFYKSTEFRRLKEEVLREQHYECQECKKLGKITEAEIVHHVQFVRKYPELALSKYYTYKGKQYKNLVALCKPHHNKAHPEKMKIRIKPKLYIITGLPGAGKTTYVMNRKNKNDLVYDLDYIVNAITYSNPNSSAIYLGNQLLNVFILESMKMKAINVYVIRSCPRPDEIELFDRYKATYIDIDTDIDTCKSRRNNITDDEFNKIIFKYRQYKQYKHNANETNKNIERW